MENAVFTARHMDETAEKAICFLVTGTEDVANAKRLAETIAKIPRWLVRFSQKTALTNYQTTVTNF